MSPDPRSPTVSLAVIVPVLDEPVELPRLLDELRAQDLALQIVIADGGSREPPTPQPDVTVLRTPRGRGRQMNAGAAACNAPYLLFLHADSHLPHRAFLREALAAFEREVRAGDSTVAGHFALRFRREHAGRERLFHFMEAKTRSGRPGTVNGDQGLMIGREFFDALGGFDEDLPFFEDARFARRVFAQGRWWLLPGVLETSARRFEAEGHVARYALMGLMAAMHEAGIENFLHAAPGLYAQQDRARPLELAPFLRLARRLGLQRLVHEPASVRAWGRALRHNAWQLGLALDPAGDKGWEQRFDRWLGAGQEKPAADAVLGLIAAGASLVLPTLAARFVDRQARGG